jgi:hypothetical protein
MNKGQGEKALPFFLIIEKDRAATVQQLMHSSKKCTRDDSERNLTSPDKEIIKIFPRALPARYNIGS